MSDRRLPSNIIDTEFGVCSSVYQKFDDGFCPICPVAKESQITQRFLGTTKLPFDFAQLVRKLDEELSVTVSLMLRKCKDTGNVVSFSRFLFLGEIANDMATCRISNNLW